MESADNSCSSESFSSSKEISCSKTQNVLATSVNITKDVTLQLAAPVLTGDDDDVSKLNSLQTTLSSMSSYLSHLKTGLKGYDLQEPPTDAHLSFESLTSSNFPDLLNYNVAAEKGASESSKNSTKRSTRSACATPRLSKYSNSRLKEEKIDDFDLDQDASEEMDGLDNKLETDNSDFIDDELLSMFTSVHNTTIESLKARLMASRLPDGSTENDLGTLLVAAKIDLTVDEIVTPPLNTVKKLMDSHTLTDWQQTLCLKIRRRKKNTAAVRSSRRKRNQYVVDLRHNVDDLKRRKKEASEQNILLRTLTVLWERLCSEVEEELKEGINTQFNHKIQLDTLKHETQEYVYSSDAANLVFNQLSPPPENTTTMPNHTIAIIQQPTTYDPMSPPASIEQISPTSSTLVSPMEIATNVFEQPCINSSYVELPTNGQQIHQLYNHTLSTENQQTAPQPINISYLNPQITNLPIIGTTSSSQVFLTTDSEVVSSTRWITTSGTENSSSSSLSPLSSPSAQLSPSPPHSPNSSHVSSVGSPQLFISESKSVSPSIPSSQVSPTLDIEPLYDTSKLQNNEEAAEGHKVVIQLQNHQLQQLKNQLSLFMVSNSKCSINNSKAASNSFQAIRAINDGSTLMNKEIDCTVENTPSSTPNSTTDVEPGKYRLNGLGAGVQLVHNSNTNLLSVLKHSSNESSSDLSKRNYFNMKNNVFLKVEDEFRDEITPNSPPTCHPIAMPLNVQIKQEIPNKSRDYAKSHFRAIQKGPVVTSSQLVPLLSTKIQSSSMSTFSPSIMHRLGKRPSSFNNCLLSLPSSNKAQKRDCNEKPVSISNTSNLNVITMNSANNVSSRANIISGQFATKSAFVTTTSNIVNPGKRKNVENCLRLIKPANSSHSMFLNSATTNTTTSSMARINPKLVVLRSSLPPKMMRKVIGISPPRGPAGISPALIPSNAIPTSNILSDNLVCMM